MNFQIYELVIGLEINAQLLTKKNFSAATALNTEIRQTLQKSD